MNAPTPELSPIVKAVSQAKINEYAEASGDYNLIHIDEAFAAVSPLGGTIAHGMLVLAYLAEMITAAYGERWLAGGRLQARFRAPTRPGDTVSTSGRPLRTVEENGVPVAEYGLECRNQKGG